MKLSAEQNDAINATTDEHVRIIANAGSGKTEVIACRIAKIAQLPEIDPSKIWAATFSNEASFELKERIANKLGSNHGVTVSNIHKLCGRILRESTDIFPNHEHVPGKKFKVVTAQAQSKIVKEILTGAIAAGDIEESEIGISSSVKTILGWKSQALDCKQAIMMDTSLGTVYQRTCDFLLSSALFDFDDIISQCNKILSSNDDILTYYQDQLDFFFIDEFQDINAEQELFIKLLAGEKHITVVGDDSQSIFGFRGATAKHFIEFDKRFDKVQTYFLGTNYRSLPSIVSASSQLISETAHIKKEYKANVCAISDSNTLRSIIAESDDHEAKRIASEIKSLQKLGLKNKEIAILCRTNEQIEFIQSELVSNGIRVSSSNNKNIFDRVEIKMALSILEGATNPSETVIEDGFYRVLNAYNIKTPKDFKKLTITEGMELIQDVNAKCSIENLLDSVATASNLDELVLTITAPELYGNYYLAPKELVEEANMSTPFYRVDQDERQQRLAAFGRCILTTNIDQSKSLSLIDEVLLTGIQPSHNDDDSIKLMTIHASKGKQFSAVFIPGLYDGSFPINSPNTDHHEERNLAFVAMTRAKHLVYLIGRKDKKSRFVKALPQYLLFDASVTPTEDSSTVTYEGDRVSTFKHKMAYNELKKTLGNCAAYTNFDKVKHKLLGLRDKIVQQGELKIDQIEASDELDKSLFRIILTNSKLLDLDKIESDISRIGAFINSTPARLCF